LSVRKATPEDIHRIAPALAEAFSSDPPMMWFTPEEEGRVERLVPYFHALVGRLHMPHGEVWVSDDPVGAAAWVKPGAWPFSMWTRRGVILAELRTFGRHPIRVSRGVEAIERNHPAEPHWYLEFIGVERSGHGQGTGSALLRPMLERCDAEDVPAYLNAGSPRSRELYRRHGFEVTEEFRLPYDGPPLWRMWRDPRV
jgi:GNAT superfamily N-acetyltransferase